jgi:hypothetical protein
MGWRAARPALLAMLLGLPLLVLVGPAAAQAPGGYSITGVPAEATAENGVLARERALANGRRAAWERLAGQAGIAPPQLSDDQIEAMVSSMVIESERATQSRYTGRITVNFNPNRTRGLLGSGVAAIEGGTGQPGQPAAPPPPAAASTYIQAVASYGSLQEWLELRQRLRGAPIVASLDVQAIAVNGARLRLGLRGAAAAAANDLAGLGISLTPGLTAGGGDIWQVGLGGAGTLPGRVGLAPRG